MTPVAPDLPHPVEDVVVEPVQLLLLPSKKVWERWACQSPNWICQPRCPTAAAEGAARDAARRMDHQRGVH